MLQSLMSLVLSLQSNQESTVGSYLGDNKVFYVCCSLTNCVQNILFKMCSMLVAGSNFTWCCIHNRRHYLCFYICAAFNVGVSPWCEILSRIAGDAQCTTWKNRAGFAYKEWFSCSCFGILAFIMNNVLCIFNLFCFSLFLFQDPAWTSYSHKWYFVYWCHMIVITSTTFLFVYANHL